MTENEAKDWLRAISATQSESIHKSSLGLRKEALYVAIQALEEIQQYRAIGTVEEFKALKEKEELFDRNIRMFANIGVSIRAKAIDECIKIIDETAWRDADMLVESIKELKGARYD